MIKVSKKDKIIGTIRRATIGESKAKGDSKDESKKATADSEPESITVGKEEKVTVASKDGKADEVTVASKDGETDEVTVASKDGETDEVTVASKDGKADEVTVASKDGETDEVTVVSKDGKADEVTVASKDGETDEVTVASKDGETDEVTVASKDGKADEVTVASKDGKHDEVTIAIKDGETDEVTVASKDGKTDEVTVASNDCKADEAMMARKDGKTDEVTVASKDGKTDEVTVASKDGKTDEVTVASKDGKADKVTMTSKDGKADEVTKANKDGERDVVTNANEIKSPYRMLCEKIYSTVDITASLSAVNDHNCHPPLVYACMQGNMPVVKLLLQHGADVCTLSDETPLTAACKHGHTEIVDILLRNTPRSNISQRNMYGMTPLQVAVKYHHGVIAKSLINIYGADSNDCKALDTQFIEVMMKVHRRLLMSFSIVKERAVWESVMDSVPGEKPFTWWRTFTSLMRTEEAGMPPIVMAFKSKQFDLVKFFVEQKVQCQPLFKAAALQDICQIACAPILLEFLAQADKTHMAIQAALDVVIKSGSTNILGILLSKLHVDARALVMALTQSCEVGSQDMVNLLIQHEPKLVKSIQHSLHETCRHPLCIAITNSDVGLTVMLHKSGAQLFNDVSTEEKPTYYTLCEGSLRQMCSRQDEFSDVLPLLLPKYISHFSLSDGLLAACTAACARAARLFLDRSADVDCCDEGLTPLHATIQAQSSEIVSLLLAAGADVNKADSKHKTPLYVATDQEHCEIATKLIDAGADTNPEACSPLLTACQHNYLDIIELLLENKANPNQTFSEGHILQITHKAEHFEAVRLLLEYGADASILHTLGLKTSCELGYTQVAKYIVHDMLDQSIKAACQNGFLNTVFEVIMSINNEEGHGLHLVHTLQQNVAVTVETSTQRKIDTLRDDTSLWQCLRKRDIAKMRDLFKEDHDVNSVNAAGRSLLQECIQQGITHVIPDLCSAPKKIHIDHKDSAGRTALFYSLTCPYVYTKQGNLISVFEYLVSQGADVKVRDHFGRSILHEWQPVSDGTKCGPSLDTLVTHIDINSVDYKGQTALHLAVLNNNITKVRQLLKHGADMEAHDINGITPLLQAERNHNMFNILHENHPSQKLKVSDLLDTDNNRQCVHMLKGKSKQHRLVSKLKEVFHERSRYTQTENFLKNYAGRVYHTMQQSIHDEMLTFKDTVIQMLTKINAVVSEEEPVLSFKPRMSGSCAEGTKVIAMDEADMLCVFDHDSWQHVTLSPVMNDSSVQANPSFAQITSHSTEHQHLLNGRVLSKQKLLQRLYSLIRKALPTVLKTIDSLYMIDVKNSVANDHSLACLSMVWHGKELPWQEFTVDVVPAIPVTQQQLPDVTRQAMSHTHIVQDLFVVPKTGTFDQSQNDAVFRLSFSSTERDLFLAMPAALKQGYMLTKVLVRDCVTIDNIYPGVCSYNLKTATFECFQAEVPNWADMVIWARKGDHVDETPAEAQTVVKHAQQILAKLENDFAEKHQSSFFFQGCDLMVHSIDKHDYRQVLYVKYCRALLSDTCDAAWTNMAEYVAEQLLLSENMHQNCFLKETETLLDMGLTLHKNIILGTMIKVGQVGGVRMLLERGASVFDVDGYGTTALQLARSQPSQDVCSFLEENTKGTVKFQ